MSDTRELTEKLRKEAALGNNIHGPWPQKSLRDAAEAITTLLSEKEALEKELAEARKALEPFAKLAANYENSNASDWVGYRGAVYVCDLRAARRASHAGGGE